MSKIEYKDLLYQISEKLDESELPRLIFMCSEEIPESSVENIRDVLALFKELEKHNRLGIDLLDILKEILKQMKKRSLLKKVEEFETRRKAQSVGIVSSLKRLATCIKGAVKLVCNLRTIAGGLLVVSSGMALRSCSSLDEFVEVFNKVVLVSYAKLVEISEGSLCFTVQAETSSALKELWDMYRSGTLQNRLQEFLVTDEIKQRARGEDVEVTVYIDEQEYKAAYVDLILLQKQESDVTEEERIGGRRRRNSDSFLCFNQNEDELTLLELNLERQRRQFLEEENKKLRAEIAMAECVQRRLVCQEEEYAQGTEDLKRPRKRRRRNSDSSLYCKARYETTAQSNGGAETKHLDSDKYRLIQRYLQNIQETHSMTTETSDSGIRTHGEPFDIEMEDISGRANSDRYRLIQRYLQNIQETLSMTTETSDSGIRTHGEPSDIEIEDISVSSICKDVLERRNFKTKCEEFLTKVSVPASWPEGNAYRLHQGNPTYRYRKKLLSNFIRKRVSKGFTVKSSTTKQFFDELQEFSELSESNDSFSEFWSSEHPALIDLFEQNIKLCGPVVRKSSMELKVSVLIRTRRHNRQDDNLSLTEHIIDLQNELKEGCRIKVGDIVEVTKCGRNEGVAFKPEVIKCYSRDQYEMDSFLELVLKCVETEGSTAAVTELSRCHAVWDYILELSTEKYTPEMALQILSILDKICSSAQKQMSHTVSKIVRGFQQSVFFMSFLPCFVEKMTDESNISVVQSILEHVVSVIPAAAPKVLPMAKVLSQNLVNGSHDLQTAKQNVQSTIGFLSKLSSIIALNVPEALEDRQSLQWKDLPLIPVVEEIHKPRVTTDDLPVIREQGKYSTEDEYFNTNFRLLREECFYKLRRGIHDFVTPGNKCDLKEIMMYRICLRGMSTAHEKSPTAMLLSLEYEMPDENEWEPSNWLLFGDLLCISIDGSFQEPVWAVVERHIIQQRIIRISLCEKANRISEAEFITTMQEVTNRNKRAFMAESQTFYHAFGPAMEVLQHKDCVPFKEFLVYPDPDYMEPAEYVNEIKSPPDWDIIFHRESLLPHEGESSDYSLLKDFERIRLNSSCKSKLDETQLAAVELALKNKLVLIQGPPGTGKSFVGVALVHLLLSMKVPQNYGPILVVTYRNLALDNFLLDCVKKVSSPDVKIVRVGTLAEDADIKLKQCLLREVGRSWPERLYRQKRKLQGRLWGMQVEVRRTFQKLTFSSIFNAYMFLEEASDDQTRSLLMDNESQTVDRALVETLLKHKDHNHISMSQLRELVDEALRKWLPSQAVFDCFAGEKKVSEQKTRSAGIAKQNSEDDQDQENPNDFRDPSVEEKERRLAVGQDEEEEGALKDEDTDLKTTVSGAVISSRKLICVDETKVNPFKNLLDAVKVWELEENERVQLVYIFQSRNYKKASREFLDVSSEYTRIHHQFKELRNQHDIEVMKSCHVIGMTVTGATIRANMLADIKPAVMIVEEAAEILEGQLVAVIPPSVQHLLMIGDHKQLRPAVHFHRLKKHHHLDLSMFERLFNCRVPHRQLGFQCRMRDEIVDLLRELKIYKNLKTNHELVRRNVLPNCVESSMYFWTHTSWEKESSKTSKRNTREAKEITEVATTFCVRGGVPPRKITVLCSYHGQVLEIRKQFQNSAISALADILVTTIDSFQGQENDIILISLVRSNREGKIGDLSSMNRLCVAISRARCGLYLFGNHAHLAKASRKGWRVVTDFMWKMKCRGSRFPFRDNRKAALHSESQFQGNFNTREKPTSHTTIHANGATVIFGGSHSVNTITTSPGNGASGTGPPRHLEMPISASGKIIAHDPTSQEGCPPQCMEGGDGSADIRLGFVPVQVAEREGHGADVESTKEARKPIQVTAEAKKSFSDLSEIEKAKERPIQESQNQRNSIPGTTAKAEQFVADDKEVRQPTQATSEVEKASADVSELENMKEKPVQESESQKSSILGTPAMGDEFIKEAPVQESEQPQAKKDELKENSERSMRHVFQEGDLKELAEVRQESEDQTNEDLKVEIEDQRDGGGEQPLQETHGPGIVQRTEAEETAQVEEGEVPHEELSEGKPLQESTSSDVQTKTCKEEPLPTQETMPTGKGPFEKTLDEVGIEGQPSVSEGKPLQEHDNSDVQYKICEEEALPTQETMAAGKGPFEETGLEVGVKGQPTDKQDK